jgi:hypothetical protein
MPGTLQVKKNTRFGGFFYACAIGFVPKAEDSRPGKSDSNVTKVSIDEKQGSIIYSTSNMVRAAVQPG